MLKSKKHWFTLAEVVIACSIFAIVVVWIIFAINRSFMFMNNTKLSVRAANFAREWVEMMYSIRDTNWRKHSWERDKYWLNLWQTLPWNENRMFTKWIFVIKEWKEDNNYYLYAEDLWLLETNLNDFYSDNWFWSSDYATYREKTKLNLGWKYSYYELNDETGEQDEKEWNVQDALIWDWLDFYRIVRIFGVYNKNTSSADTVLSFEDSKKWIPAEMRFCVKVFYASQWKHSSEICGVMTNFME